MTLTPLMRQYYEIKNQNPDALLFFRLGDFYEMFGDDAKEGSRLLGLALTARGDQPMCGVPYHSANSYIAKLLKAGKKLAICEQTSNITNPKTKLFERKIVKIITPGTVLEDSMLEAGNSNYLLAVETDKNGWGIACLEASTGDFWITQKDNDEDMTSLSALMATINPSEIIGGKELLKHTIVKPVVLPDNVPTHEIKVGLGMRQNGRPSSRETVHFISSHDFKITDAQTGKLLASGKGKESWVAVLKGRKTYLLSPKNKRIPFQKSILVTPSSSSPDEGTTIIVKNVMSGAGMTWASVDDKEYRGKLQITHNTTHNTLIPINIVNIEEYLMGVIASEMPTQFPMNALRAQAVLARTYALKHLGKHKYYGYDLCDTQNCQVYGGVSSESERGNAAVESTMGEIMRYKKKPIESVFSANCGGVTQSAKEAGWYETPYLQPVSDYKDFDFDTLQPYHFKELLQYPHDAYSRYDKHVSLAAFRWTRVVDVEDVSQVIKRKKKDIGRVTGIIPLRRGRSGYVSRLMVKGTKGNIILNKENVIRNNLSLGMLRSSYFIVEPNYRNHELEFFVFYGGGWGHGVGFDQTGAAGRAEDGQDYKEILHHYFPLAEFYSPSQAKNTSNK